MLSLVHLAVDKLKIGGVGQDGSYRVHPIFQVVANKGKRLVNDLKIVGFCQLNRCHGKGYVAD